MNGIVAGLVGITGPCGVVEPYAAAIIGDLLAGSAGWIDWNILLDANGGPNHLNNTCDAPIVAGDVRQLDPQYFALRLAAVLAPGGPAAALETAGSASRGAGAESRGPTRGAAPAAPPRRTGPAWPGLGWSVRLQRPSVAGLA